MAKREIQEINASSMADISFLLLIFFLVSTSMATDKGLSRRLPDPVPPDKEKIEEEVEINKRNIMIVLINSNDQLMVNGELMRIEDLKDFTKDFIANPGNKSNLPVKVAEDVPGLGRMMITKDHVISLQNDRGTSYQAYINVQNELMRAYNELREELSREKFGMSVGELKDDEKKKAIQTVYPQRISEADPKDYSKYQNQGGVQ